MRYYDNDLIGMKFSSLTITRVFREKKASRMARMVECVCDCGNVRVSEFCNLPTGNTKICKECSSQKKSKSKRVHGHSEGAKGRNDLEKKCYYTWQAMKRRCYNENDKRFSDYGGRGISVSNEWMNSYELFLIDMGLPPSKDYQIDRSDNNGNYNKGNCGWVTRSDNARNKRNNKLISANGETKTQVEWSEVTGIKRETIAMRIRRGWTEEQALGFIPRK